MGQCEFYKAQYGQVLSPAPELGESQTWIQSR